MIQPLFEYEKLTKQQQGHVLSYYAIKKKQDLIEHVRTLFYKIFFQRFFKVLLQELHNPLAEFSGYYSNKSSKFFANFFSRVFEKKIAGNPTRVLRHFICGNFKNFFKKSSKRIWRIRNQIRPCVLLLRFSRI